MPTARIQELEERPQLLQVTAPAGLPFLVSAANDGVRAPAMNTPRTADIVTGGRGGGAESGGSFDPTSSGDNDGGS